jgi:hypothetical protein
MRTGAAGRQPKERPPEVSRPGAPPCRGRRPASTDGGRPDPRPQHPTAAPRRPS